MDKTTFSPLPKQEKFIKSTADQVLLSGSFGAGKSRSGCEKGYFLNMKYPGNRGLICRKSFSDLELSTIGQTLLEEVIPESHIHYRNKSKHYIEHYTGERTDDGEPILSEIYYHGLDSGRKTGGDDLPRKIGSTAFGWIFVDEGTELSRGEWSQLQGRLRYKGKSRGGKFYSVPFRQIFSATNPASPQHWMYKTFFDKGQGEVIKMNLHDNPYLPKDYVERQEERHSGIFYDRYVKGEWVGAEGMIYHEYDPDIHLKDPQELPGDWDILDTKEFADMTHYSVDPPDNWRIYRTMDFGFTAPFVCLWVAQSPDNQLVVFKEIYKTGELMEDIAKDIKNNTKDDWTMEINYADPAQAEDLATLKRKGIGITKAKKDVSPGIQAVKHRLKTDERGEPGIYFMRGSRLHEADGDLQMEEKPLKTIDELPKYRWKENSEEEPKKEDDHGCDALRYLIFSIDGRAQMTSGDMKKWEELANEVW